MVKAKVRKITPVSLDWKIYCHYSNLNMVIYPAIPQKQTLTAAQAVGLT